MIKAIETTQRPSLPETYSQKLRDLVDQMLNIKLEDRITVDQIIELVLPKFMLQNSKICKKNKEKMFLINTLGGKLFEATLLYQTDELDR